jgi:hypothetical protein
MMYYKSFEQNARTLEHKSLRTHCISFGGLAGPAADPTERMAPSGREQGFPSAYVAAQVFKPRDVSKTVVTSYD